MPRASLFAAWKNGSFIRLLSGLTLEPLRAEGGVDSWIASRLGGHASLSRRSANDLEKTIQDTCGRTCGESSKKCSQESVSSRTSATIYEWDSRKSTMTFEAWVTELRQVCSQRMKLVHLTSEADSSLWATPRASDGMCHQLREAAPVIAYLEKAGRKIPQKLEDRVVLWMAGWMPGRLSPIGLRTHDGPRQVTYLNPRFLEHLMGLPIGWTEPELAETQWCRWWRRMRGEYLKMRF